MDLHVDSGLHLQVDSGSHFHFLHHCRIRDVRKFLNIFYTVTHQFLWNLAKWLMQTRQWKKQHFGSDLADIWIWIMINPEIWIQILDHFRLTLQPWRSLHFLNALVCVVVIVFHCLQCWRHMRKVVTPIKILCIDFLRELGGRPRARWNKPGC